MRAMILTATAMALTLAACSQGETAEAAATAAPATQAVTLIDQPALGEDLEALPRLTGGTPAITAINADLARMDASAVAAAADCVASADGGPGGGSARSITRPMTGPAYLTLRQHAEWYCGGPYPATAQTAVTWDLATGARLDWAAAVPGLGLTAGSTEDMPADYVAPVSSAALGAWYSRKMLASTETEWVEQCRDVFDPAQLAEQSFNIWADAETGGVTVQPDFPHVVQACAESATLTAADLTGFDAAPSLVEAITTAHAAGNWSPKE